MKRQKRKALSLILAVAMLVSSTALTANAAVTTAAPEPVTPAGYTRADVDNLDTGVYNFNLDWLYYEPVERLSGNLPTVLEKVKDASGKYFYEVGFDDSAWESVSVPHAINSKYMFQTKARRFGDRGLYVGFVFYRKHFELPAEAAGKKVFIEFEGIKHASYVYLNGVEVGYYEAGVTAFGFDLSATGALNYDGPNVLALAADNRIGYSERSGVTSGEDSMLYDLFYQYDGGVDSDFVNTIRETLPGSPMGSQDSNHSYRWFSNDFNPTHGGITQDVKLYVKDQIFQTLPIYRNLRTQGVYIYPSDITDITKPGDAGEQTGTATINIQSEIRNESGAASNIAMDVVLVGLDGQVAYTRSFDAVEIAAATDVDKNAAINMTAVPDDPAFTLPEGNGNSANLRNYAWEKVDLSDAAFRDTTTVSVSFDVTGLNLWSTVDPYLYDVYTILKRDGKVIDVVKTTTGFRKVEFRPGVDAGVFINDEYVWLTGYAQRATNEWAAIGIPNDWLTEYEFQMMRDSNANFIRWMHISPPPKQVRAGDKYGIACVVPAGDKEDSSHGSRMWNQRMEVMRDTIIYFRNSPSVLFWEIGNNAPDAAAITGGRLTKMQEIKDTLDPNGMRSMNCRAISTTASAAQIDSVSTMLGRQVTTGNDSWTSQGQAIRNANLIVEVEYTRNEAPKRVWDNWSPPNYQYHNYYAAGNVGETSDISARSADDKGQFNGGWDSWDLNAEDFVTGHAASYNEFWSRSLQMRPGNVIYSGAAALNWSDSNQHGRQTGSETGRMSGRVDALRIPKQSYYAYQTLQSKEPSVYLVGHWNYPTSTDEMVYENRERQTWPGSGSPWNNPYVWQDTYSTRPATKTIYALASNVGSVELFVNGVSAGVRNKSQASNNFLYSWANINILTRGDIYVVGYAEPDGAGGEVARMVIETVGDPVALRLTPKTGADGFLAGGSDYAFIDIEVVDAEGRVHPLNYDKISFELVRGDVQIMGGYNSGTDHFVNYDETRELRFSTNYGWEEGYNKDHIYAENGVNRLFLKSGQTAGDIEIKFTLHLTEDGLGKGGTGVPAEPVTGTVTLKTTEIPMDSKGVTSVMPQPYERTADDRNLPDMPLNVEYTPITENSVTIKWDAVEGADGYNIYRRDSKSSALEKIGTVASAGWFDDTVVEDTDYYYAIAAYNGDGEGVKTKEAFIMLANDTTVELSEFTLYTSQGSQIRGSRLRLGDLDGDGRTDILVCNTSRQGDTARNGTVLYYLAAFNIEGTLMWEFTLDPAWDGAASGIGSSSADEPVNVGDIDGDGFLEVVAVMHPEKNRGTVYGGASFVVLDGRTGQIKKDAAGKDCMIPFTDIVVPGLDYSTAAITSGQMQQSVNNIGDCIVFADLDGRGMRNHIVMKGRYEKLSAFEMFDKDGNFVMKHLWRDAEGRSGQAQTGHMPLAYDIDGDGCDEIVSNYSVFKGVDPDPGSAQNRKTPVWSVPNRIVDKDGNPVLTPSGSQYTATDHVDTIQVGDVLGDGNLYIVFGGGGAGVSTFCYDINGDFVWANDAAKEPQSLNLAQFRTDADGLLLYGLDRRVRNTGNNDKDGMFLIGTHGETLYLEPDNWQGFGSIVIRVDNWTGTYAPLCLSFFRNGNSAQTTQPYKDPDPLTGYAGMGGRNPERDKMPAFYDGYFNSLFNVADNDGQRFMAMDLCGDSRTELVAYNDSGLIIIYYNNSNGDVKTEEDKLAVLRSGITGVAKPQTLFMMNYSRYPTDVFVPTMADRIPAQPQARNVTPSSAYIDWTPIITADSYTLYKNDVKIGTFTDVGYQDNSLIPNMANVYYVVAHEKGEDSQASLPLVVSNAANMVTFMDGDAVYATRNIVPGLSLGASFPAAPSKTGYRFLGWFDGDVAFTAESIVTGDLTVFARWEAVATLTGVNFSGFTSLVVGYAANIPVSVTAVNADGQSVIVGLFAGGEEIASATLVNGAAVIKAPVINNANVEIRAKFAGGDWAVSRTIPMRALPTNIWAPVVDVRSPEGKTNVDFAEAVTLTSKAAAAINGVPAAVAASGATLVIDAGSAANDVIVISGVKYPALFPSYSFTFTVVRGEDPVPPPEYTVTFVLRPEMSSIYATVKVFEGESLGDKMPDNPAREEYVFTGWVTVPDSTPFTAATIVNSNLLVYATWKASDEWTTVISEDFSGDAPYKITGGSAGLGTGASLANTGTVGTYDGRRAFNVSGTGNNTGIRSARGTLSQTVTPGDEGLVMVSFDWRPGTPEVAANPGILAIEASQIGDPPATGNPGNAARHKLLIFIVQDGQLRFRTEQFTRHNETSPGGTLINKTNLEAWYKIEVVFDFVNRKIDLSISNDSNDPDTEIFTVDFDPAIVSAADVSSFYFACNRSSGNANWSTSIANLDITVK